MNVKKNDHEMGFLDHLEELRWRLIKSVFSIIIGSILSFNYMDHILEILLQPTLKTSVPINLQVLSCLLYTSPSPRDKHRSRMPSSA